MTQLTENTKNRINDIKAAVSASQESIDWLIERHFEPTGLVVHPERKFTVIHIEHSKYCEDLKKFHGAYCYMLTPSANGRNQVWRAQIFNCVVEWLERDVRTH